MNTGSVGIADEPAESRDFVTALARGLDVLRVCAQAPEGLTLADVARQVDLPRAAVRRALLTLVTTGYLVQYGRLFQVTPRVLDLSARMKDLPLPRLAQPILNQLSETLNESASLAILDGRDILYIARTETRRILAVDLTVGARLPAWCTSMGRVLLAALPDTERRGHMPPVLDARTPRTTTDLAALGRLFAQIRRDGYCVQDQELETGLRSVAAPVRGPDGTVVAALNVSTQAARTSMRDLRKLVIPAVVDAATALGHALKGQTRA
ncbi:IclR family transcriptional regulator C-terminal domain-containing protein [Gluconacetobacter sacchari]|uniref:Helix-turn-helix domain-containing protein n=2 Tax=Gluconacetobacter sacchari TaxID=92759 RepID=A0A7W4IF54_9PROT|nr:IclR family transcriptional regulator C-terminal domain-containing protein [Gluconacetobacter sacchari]MBB2161629.1 helix-turn-helix domain-containing protein [Gluconacetobacter sacchari]GBQ19087.1 transcriptional regulator [Gluconacetobacter sacchari DSM 12717]